MKNILLLILSLITLSNISAATIDNLTSSKCTGDKAKYKYNGSLAYNCNCDKEGKNCETCYYQADVRITGGIGSIWIDGSSYGSFHTMPTNKNIEFEIQWFSSGSVSISVTFSQIPSLSANGSDYVEDFSTNIFGGGTIYNGESTQIVACCGDSYTWSCVNTNFSCNFTGQGTSNIVASPSINTKYTVSITKSGCQTTKTASVDVNILYIRNNKICCDQTVCERVGSLGQQLNASISGSNSLSYQWQTSTNNSTFSNISGANSSAYVPSLPTNTTYFRRLVNNEASNSITISPILNSEKVDNKFFRPFQTPNTGYDPINRNYRAKVVDVYGQVFTRTNERYTISASKNITIYPKDAFNNSTKIMPNIKLLIESCVTIDTYRKSQEEVNDNEQTIVNETFDNTDIKISPNPTSGKINLHIPANEALKNISVFNLDGAEVYSNPNFNLLENNLEIDLSYLISGIYLVRIHKQDDTLFSTKLSIIKN